MNIIKVSYHGPTNNRGSRFTAVNVGGECARASVSVAYDYTLNITENYDAAARAWMMANNRGHMEYVAPQESRRGGFLKISHIYTVK